VTRLGLRVLGLRAGGGDPLELALEAGDRVVALRPVAVSFVGAVADDEALGGVARGRR
jgi:hypothetical protein